MKKWTGRTVDSYFVKPLPEAVGNMKIKRKVKTWKFDTTTEAADFFLLALTANYDKGHKIVEAIYPNRVKVTLLPKLEEIPK